MRFIVDEITASEMIPIRLLISITVISLISFFVINGIILNGHITNEGDFVQELDQLKQNIELMIFSGEPRDVSNRDSPSGTKQVHSLFIPSEITMISFGVGGSNENTWFSKLNSSGICYCSQKTGINTIWVDDSCLFVKGIFIDNHWIPCWNDSIFSIDQKGECMITFELITHEDQLFVLVYDENNIP